ncbi:hypothetical protein IQ07DRAFT_590933 [Pyrenochaeta sp. DS3sAY3a]|nr:hypothetical protein IQ07DRAFT_590933 [Pyrenochaeta sp. DS3sAY3a]
MLGHIKVDIMNRAPVELKLDSWKQIEVQTRAPASCTHDRVFIDTVSLILWKRQFHTRIDLRDLGYELNGEWKSIWTRYWYGGGGMAPKYTETKVHKARPPGLWLTDPVDLSNGENGTGLKYVMPYLGHHFRQGGYID